MELENADKIEKRCQRYNVPDHGHELTFSCYRRMPLLKILILRDEIEVVFI